MVTEGNIVAKIDWDGLLRKGIRRYYTNNIKVGDCFMECLLWKVAI